MVTRNELRPMGRGIFFYPKGEYMKRKLASLFLIVLVVFSITPLRVNANQERKEFRVGMEVAYAPFNWSQKDDSNGAVKVEGSNEYANGYDVQIAKRIADELGLELVIVKTEWDGLLPAVQSGKIDAIIAGMSPTKEREEVLDFTHNYYESQLVLVTRKDSKYANAKNLEDFSGANIVAQLNTFHDTVIDQIPGVNHKEAMADFSAMRVAIESGKMDAYVAERPEGLSAELANDVFKMVELEKGFTVDPNDTSIAIGLNKGSKLLQPINNILNTSFAKDRKSVV